jgi:hypothetical protein
MMRVPAEKQHAKIHGARSKDKMEKAIAIWWYAIFRLYYVHELQAFKPYFSLNGAKTIHISIDLFSSSKQHIHTCIHL